MGTGGGPALRPERFAALWRSLALTGHGAAVSSPQARAQVAQSCLEWFTEEAIDRELDVETGDDGDRYAWWGDRGAPDSVLTGGHLDAPPGGSPYEGALGVVGALLAIDLLREWGVTPRRPIGVALLATPPGTPPTGTPPTGAFVELALDEGRVLTVGDAPVAIATGGWARGRWRLEFAGPGGSTGAPMADRCDPMLTLAFAVLAANKEARLHGCRALVGRVAADPGAPDTVAYRALGWLDARAPDEATLTALVGAVTAKAADRAGRDGTGFRVECELAVPAVAYHPTLAARMAAALPGAPAVVTPGRHVAATLAGRVPTGLLLVRASDGGRTADCAAGVTALATVLAALALPTDPARTPALP